MKFLFVKNFGSVFQNLALLAFGYRILVCPLSLTSCFVFDFAAGLFVLELWLN